MTELRYFGFDGEKPTPARPSALKLADALIELTEAREELEQKMNNVPDYTGQWSSEDYYAEAQERYNRAADNYEAIVKGMTFASIDSVIENLDPSV